MLRRADNVGVTFSPGWLTGKGWLVLAIGKRQRYRVVKVHKDEFARTHALQRRTPVRVAKVEQRTDWQYQDRFYWDNDDLTAEQVHALLVTRHQRQSQQIDRAQAMVAMGAAPRSSQRRGIADDVKQFVWMRDGGACRHCASVIELQFDHVIPVSMGGSSEAENLQVLCGPCNRRKAAGLTVR